MSKIDLTKLRNIGIIAHIDAGKTTTTDHILYFSGAKHKLGEVDKGTTETDYDPEEQQRGITIYSACIPFKWRDCTVNLIDTPGHVDFTAEVERSLRVLDGAVVVFDAQKGVEAQSETVWRQADKYNVPRLVFVNKMDVVGAHFANVLDEIKERLEGTPAPLTIPIGAGSIKDGPTPFRGLIDLLEMKAYFYDGKTDGKSFRAEPVPADQESEARHWREQLFEVLTRHDEKDRITSAYLEGKEIPATTLRELLREQALARHIQPVLCGSGREHIGIQPLMDAVCHYLPSPLDRPPVTGLHPQKKDKEEKRKPDPKDPFAALVFKIVADSHGDLYYLRVYSGTLKANSRPFNPTRNLKEFASKIYHVLADPRHRDDLPEAVAGDIVAIVGPKDSITGDTICDIQNPIVLEQIQFAEAVVSMSIEPESSADKDRLTDALNRLKREDPTFNWRVDADTGQTLMNGMGILHLEVKQHRLERDFRLKVRVGKPRVSYRETLKRSIQVEGECIKQAGAAGLFAKLKVSFEPKKLSESVVVVNKVAPEMLPTELMAAAEQGIRGALQSGELGYPVINVQATILGGQMQEGLSNEIAFTAAGTDAVHRALKDNMVLLEPVMRTEVMVPEEYLGPVTADLNARRSEITEVHIRGKLRVIEALVPLAKMFDYSDKVRSLSQGRASWTMEPKAYAPVPPDVLRGMMGTGEEL
ncbi:MAG: elongation factor G [Gemmataceae bacterium]|nr:elongation factor G [Gemmataceae bacterium]MCI0741490.1 elongation factor G [Gemmataceae bacterium]